MKIKIPNLSLVVLIGPSGSGKSTFAEKHFLPTEVISSDFCRGLVSDDENDQTVTNQAFGLVHTIATKRLALGKLTVIDATNVQQEARKPLVAIAREFHCIPVAILFNLPEKLCQARNKKRKNRNFGSHVIRQQRSQLRRSKKGLKREGFRHIYTFESEELVEKATIIREPLWNDKRDLSGPFDIIGDIHGCCDELELLLEKLGYVASYDMPGDDIWSNKAFSHPEGRKAVFLGDLVDRGPRILDTVKIVRNMIKAGNALCVPGNHDIKFMRKLWGKNVPITHGLDKSIAELESVDVSIREQLRKELADFLHSLVSHYVLNDGKLVVSHAGMKQEMQGRGSAKVRDFALYGETTGETDEFGLPVRYNWAEEYKGPSMVVYGHTPVPEPEWLNRTINIDTGCVFGGRLTAMRYPEKELIYVPAAETYCEPAKPFLDEDEQAPRLTAQQKYDDLLDAEDVIGKRIISTRLRPNITIREENATAALEVMSRFATDPKWIIYLSPTMSPCETSNKDGYLEYPSEAFAHYRSAGVPKVVCEEKHMGSRAIIIICRNEDVVREKFGIISDGTGVVYTRTGRRFFDDKALEEELLTYVRDAMTACAFWDELNTDWVCLDCELMPWSAKAQELLRSQYASVGAASRAALKDTLSVVNTAASRDDLEKDFIVPKNSSARPADINKIISWYQKRRDMTQKYVNAYRHYCWPVNSIADLKLAPFHILATEKSVHVDKDHVWHMETIKKFCNKGKDVLLSTPYKVVDVTKPHDQKECEKWWNEITEKGGEGMVVKPFDFITRGKRGLIQPAVKVRGREYLRIIYGPEYTSNKHLKRLRSRGLGRKRSLALREFALGIEALERFVRKEPLRRVHECVFGVLALESEPVDPRL